MTTTADDIVDCFRLMHADTTTLPSVEEMAVPQKAAYDLGNWLKTQLNEPGADAHGVFISVEDAQVAINHVVENKEFDKALQHAVSILGCTLEAVDDLHGVIWLAEGRDKEKLVLRTYVSD